MEGHDLRIADLPLRAGRKPALLSQFENETLQIWKKHSIRQDGFWTKSNQEITYMLAQTAGFGVP